MKPRRNSYGGTWKPRTVVALLLGFWSLWWSLVFTTDLFDGLVHWVLSDGWTFASGDYAFLLEVREYTTHPSSSSPSSSRSSLSSI